MVCGFPTHGLGMNEQILDTLANVGVTLAAFSGVVVAFRARGAEKWNRTELRVLWFLIIDSFFVVLFALLPAPLALAGWSEDTLWGVCSALLGTWFLIGFMMALLGERQDRAARRAITIPVITPLLYGVTFIAPLVGVALWLSVWDVVPRGQAAYVAGLIALLMFAAIEFLFFIGAVAWRADDKPSTDSASKSE